MSNPDGTPDEQAEDFDADDTGDASTSEVEQTEATEPEVAEATEAPTPYTVKVDGDEVEVTLDELLSGYQRQADYTRKTQEVAAIRQLGDALEADPAGTIKLLAEAYGIHDAGGSPDLEGLDPLEREVQELRSRMEQRDAADNAARVERELADVKVKYGDAELNESALLQFAVARRIPNIEDAYKAFAFEGQAAAKAAATEAKVQAKRGAPPVESGGKRADAAVVPGASKRMSVADAFRAAQKSLT